MFEIVQKGGPIMILIIISSVIALAIIIERLMNLHKAKIDTYDFLDKIKAVLRKDKIKEISPGLPKKILPNGVESQLTIVPFYDRTQLIYETLGTLNTALVEEILVTVIVVLLMVAHLKSSMLISGLLPLAVLMSFIAMKQFGVDANIVALSGIAIAIGTIATIIVIIVN